MTPKRGVLAAVVLAALSFAAPALRAQEDPRELERYERDRRIIDEKIIRRKCDVDRRAYEEGKRNLDAALRTNDQTDIASSRKIHDNLKYSYCKCLRDGYLAARRALPPEYYRLCDPNTPPLPDLSDPPPGTGNPPPAAPAASEPCDQAQRDQADQRYRDAKLNLKEAQLSRDPERIRLAERDLEAARVEFCKCLRSIYLATGQKPDNYDEICWPRGKSLLEPAPREGQRGTDRQEGPVICGLERLEFQDAEKAWTDAGKPLDFEPGSVAQRYADARKRLCECLKKAYGSRMSKKDRELCKDPSDSWTPGGAKPNAPPPGPPVQIGPDSANPPGTESGPAPQGETPPQAPRQPRTGAQPPPPPPPPPPPAPDPNTPAPPGPGMPAPSGPGMPAADCLREGAWDFQFTVESHANNHNHEDCVKFLRRILKAIFGNFAGDLFTAKFEDLLPEMQCTKIPGCSGNCKGTLPQFAGKENVEFEIQDMRRSGDTITGKLVITSGGERLFVLRFTAAPVVAG